MARKIVGFYGSNDVAQQVYDDLIEAGFKRTDAHIYQGKDEPGLWDRIKEWFGYADEEDRNLYHEAARRGGVAVVADLEDEDSPGGDKATRIMQRHNPIDLESQAQQWRAQGWQGYRAAPTAQATTRPGTAGASISTGQPQRPAQARPGTTGREQEETIPVVQENLEVGKRSVIQGGVRIYARIIERPVEKQVELREEHVDVERRPADRPLRDTDRPFQERTIEATETTEEPVVRKEAKVVEEVTVRKDVKQRTETVRDTVRSTDVNVEKLSGERPGGATPPGSAAGTGGREFAPADFAAEMSRDRRYQGKDWEACEVEFRRSYEQRYPQSRWDQVKDKVRAEYNRIRSKV